MKGKPFDKEKAVQDVEYLDRKLFSLLVDRSAILAKLKPSNKSKRRGQLSTALEKELWKTWERGAAEHGPDATLWRALYTLVHDLQFKPHPSSRPGSKESGFVLFPKNDPAQITLPAPRSMRQTRLWACVAAQCEAPFAVPEVLDNDPLMELVKALNQAGAAIYRDGDALASRGSGGLAFVDKVVYAGDEPFNLYLLLALALREPGRVKITGGSTLKLANLRRLDKVFAALGARLANVVPRSTGLPVRLEASGVLPDEVYLDADAPPELAAALAMAAPGWPNGLTIRWAEGLPVLDALRDALRVLDQCGIDALLTDESFTVKPGVLVPAEAPELDMDPYLSAALLALPRAQKPGSRITLEGRWNDATDATRLAEKLLRDAGVALEIGPGGASAATGVPAQQIAYPLTLDTSADPLYFPLSLALGCVLLCNAPHGASVVLSAPELPAETDAFAHRFGLLAEPVDGGVQLTAPEREAPEEAPEGLEADAQRQTLGADPEPWLSPDAHWTLAFAVAALRRRGAVLTNPGSVTAAMPGFWGFYNGLPEPQAVLTQHRAEQQSEERKETHDSHEHTDAKQSAKRRRVIIR